MPKDPVVICIARDFGAEGHEIGKLVSLELGIPLYDNDLLVRTAARSGFNLEQLADFDERKHESRLGFLPDVMSDSGSGDSFFHILKQVILDLGYSQSCIIEGRLSDFILKDHPGLISVLVTAPEEARIQIVSAKRGLTPAKGKKLVRSMQKNRELFYKHFSSGKWRLHDGKDLVVDRSAFGREGAAAIICAAYREKLKSLED